jgi:type IV pilus assembly protein PilC
MIRAGETSGKLDLFLQKLVEILERREDIKRKVKSAMFYPVILVSVAVTISGFMLIKVVPVFEKMYGDMGVALPGPTVAVLAASRFVSGWGGISMVVFTVLFYLTYKFFMKSSIGFRRTMHRISLRYPLFGSLLGQSIYARIALVMSNLVAAGVSIIESLDIAMTSVDNVYVTDAMEKVKRGVFSGADLSSLFLKEKVFPPTFGQLIGVGEKTGNLEEMFISIANYYQDEFDSAVGRLSTAIEPLMIVFIGALIGILLVAMYMPIFSAGAVVG